MRTLPWNRRSTKYCAGTVSSTYPERRFHPPCRAILFRIFKVKLSDVFLVTEIANITLVIVSKQTEDTPDFPYLGAKTFPVGPEGN